MTTIPSVSKNANFYQDANEKVGKELEEAFSILLEKGAGKTAAESISYTNSIIVHIGVEALKDSSVSPEDVAETFYSANKIQKICSLTSSEMNATSTSLITAKCLLVGCFNLQSVIKNQAETHLPDTLSLLLDAAESKEEQAVIRKNYHRLEGKIAADKAEIPLLYQKLVLANVGAKVYESITRKPLQFELFTGGNTKKPVPPARRACTETGLKVAAWVGSALVGAAAMGLASYFY